mmetsp:Transcript_75839/g.203159  ORF Transcript_75839/g.203159 Transcript_75839/m.203159 type:complete len:243 (-) Transcript_75839:1777-2505(-)
MVINFYFQCLTRNDSDLKKQQFGAELPNKSFHFYKECCGHCRERNEAWIWVRLVMEAGDGVWTRVNPRTGSLVSWPPGGACGECPDRAHMPGLAALELPKHVTKIPRWVSTVAPLALVSMLAVDTSADAGAFQAKLVRRRRKGGGQRGERGGEVKGGEDKELVVAEMVALDAVGNATALESRLVRLEDWLQAEAQADGWAGLRVELVSLDPDHNASQLEARLLYSPAAIAAASDPVHAFHTR